MKLATLCSGIGAPEVAAKRLGWECLWSAEVDPQASAVLAHHHPESRNLGDITKIDGRELERPDVLVFGTPCQSFSVAGRRAGMDDPRGVLAFVALGIVGRVRPTWFVLENVPGLLSSSAGRDFGAFLRAVDELGYSGAWASPDAQFFGLAQRRERVFFVGHIGNWRYPAAVLSQFSRLCGHPAPSREARERVAPTISARTKGGGGLGTDFDCDGGLIAGTFQNTGHGWWNESPVAQTVRTPDGGGSMEANVVAHTLTKRYDSSEDGCGRGVQLVAGCLSPGAHPGGFNGQDAYDDKLICFEPRSADGHARVVGDISPTLNRMGGGQREPCVVFRKSRRAQSVDDNETWVEGEVANTINQFDVGERDTHIVFTQNTREEVRDLKDKAGALSSEPGTHQTTYVAQVQWASGGGQVENPTAQALRSGAEHNYQFLRTAMSVRRLTPRECCRLQGFPDDYTLIPYKGKPMSDGPRYKMLGNSMAVPVLKWLLKRIEEAA